MTVKLPSVAGVTATSVVLPAAISVSIFSGLDMNPCTRSALVSRRITGSPFLSVIVLGEKANFFALISITFGSTAAFAASCACTRLPWGVRAASPIPNAAAEIIVLTIRFLIMVVFIFLLVLCVIAAVFEHLIHSDGAGVLGRRELYFLAVQIAAIGIAVDPPPAHVFARSRLVEGRRLFLRGDRRVGEGEDQRPGRVHLRGASLVKVLA